MSVAYNWFFSFFVAKEIFPLTYMRLYVCIRCKKHILSFILFISSIMATSLLFSFYSHAKVLLLCFIIQFCLNVQQVYCHITASNFEKGIPYRLSLDWLVQTSSPTALSSNISQICFDHTEQYLLALRNRQSWAEKIKLFFFFLIL